MADHQLDLVRAQSRRTTHMGLQAGSDTEPPNSASTRTDRGANFLLCHGEYENSDTGLIVDHYQFGGEQHAGHPRPASIRSFEFLFVAALLAGIVQVVIGWNGVTTQGTDGFDPIIAVLVVLIKSLLIGLCFEISRRRSVNAMWVLIGIFAWGAIVTSHNVLNGRLVEPAPILLAQYLTKLIALGLLFTPASQEWLRHRV